MANNPYVNKVETADGTTLMDITDTTAEAGDVMQGQVFYAANGQRSTGTLGNFGGATSSVAGTSGLVPAPAVGDNSNFLRGDGTWAEAGKPLAVLDYGSSTWQTFLTAYNENAIIYCRVPYYETPGVEGQSIMAFMAFANISDDSGSSGSESDWTYRNGFTTTMTSGTINGVTFTVNADGSVSVSGSPTHNISRSVCSFGSITLPAGKYVARGCAYGSENDIRMQVYNESNSTEIGSVYNSRDVVFTLASEAVISLNPVIPAWYATGFTFYPAIYSTEESDPTYNGLHVDFHYLHSYSINTQGRQGAELTIYTLNVNNEWSTETRPVYSSIAAGTNMSASYNNNTLTLSSTLESKTASSGGTDVSLVTTGEKASWNAAYDHAISGSNIFYVEGPSTDETAGVWTGTITGLTAYYDGLTIIYVPAVAGVSGGTTLNINNLGDVPCYYTGTTVLGTHYPVGTPILFTYSNNGWRRADYNTNTTYSTITAAQITTGTATSARVTTAANLKNGITGAFSAGDNIGGVKLWAKEVNVLPEVTSADNGKVLMVVDGAWVLVNPT